jgi:hypothetical protein
MAALGRALWQHPFIFLSVRGRKIVLAAVAVAILGSRIAERFDLQSQLPAQVSELDSYPFSLVRVTPTRDCTSQIAKRSGRWPSGLKQRALRHLNSRVLSVGDVDLQRL